MFYVCFSVLGFLLPFLEKLLISCGLKFMSSSSSESSLLKISKGKPLMTIFSNFSFDNRKE